MYVCMCEAVTEKEVKRAITSGANTTESLQERLNVGTCCGGCIPYLEACLEEEMGAISVGTYQPLPA